MQAMKPSLTVKSSATPISFFCTLQSTTVSSRLVSLFPSLEEQMEEGWPLGLWQLNRRVGHIRSLQVSNSLSFSSIITDSSNQSSLASSDLDTESRGSFSQVITLGRLIGITRILNLSSRSFRTRQRSEETLNCKKSHKSNTCFSLCVKAYDDGERGCGTPSLGHFLQAERRASNEVRRLEDYNAPNVSQTEGGEFLNWAGDGRRSGGELCNANGFGFPFTCIGGSPKH